MYSLPPGSTVTNGDISDATDVNTPLSDLETDMNTPRPIVAGGTGASSASAALVNFGLTATATELNYVDGVTSNIQTQLDAKLSSIADGSVTFAKLADAAVVTESETIAASNNDTTIPTTAAVIDHNITLAASQATTSGTSKDFTSIPSWAKRITVIFTGVSTNGTSAIVIQLGDSGGVETSGYTSTAQLFTGATTSQSASTAGFNLPVDAASGNINGRITIDLQTGNLWVAGGTFRRSSSSMGFLAGEKLLSATLDRVRITAENGTDAFDNGTVAVSWE